MLEDLQGNILASHGRDHSVHIFLKFGPDPDAAKAWIRCLAKGYITSAKKQAIEAKRVGDDKIPGDVFANLFLSCAGYRALGFPFEKMPLDRSFLRGMKSIGTRSKLNDPEGGDWEDGFQLEIHALIVLADEGRQRLDDAVQSVRRGVRKVAAIVNVEVERRLKRNGRSVEPFGYVDGVSRPYS